MHVVASRPMLSLLPRPRLLPYTHNFYQLPVHEAFVLLCVDDSEHSASYNANVVNDFLEAYGNHKVTRPSGKSDPA